MALAKISVPQNNIQESGKGVFNEDSRLTGGGVVEYSEYIIHTNEILKKQNIK